jgi:hypothetical protein
MVLRLTTLFDKIKSAHNKVLAHNDLEALMGSAALGEFAAGLDYEYFSALQELVNNEVSRKWLDGLYPFNDLAGADVEEFLAVLERLNPSFQRTADKLRLPVPSGLRPLAAHELKR